eukprot:SAG31_NODE_154_length_22184_cov_25.917142_8_plen_100_part_00
MFAAKLPPWQEASTHRGSSFDGDLASDVPCASVGYCWREQCKNSLEDGLAELWQAPIAFVEGRSLCVGVLACGRGDRMHHAQMILLQKSFVFSGKAFKG